MWTPQSWYEEARQKATAGADHVRGMADLLLNNLCEALPNLPRDEIVLRLQRENAHRLDAVPSLQKYPELRGMRELIEAQWRGVRDGAQLNEAQAAAHNGANYYYHRYVASGRVTTGCTAVFFPHSDCGPLVSKNLDSTPDEPVEAPRWPMISEHLLVEGVSSGVFMDEESPEIFPAPVMKLVARYCRNTQEAVEILERYNHFWGPGNLLVADRDNNVAMIEKTACRIAVRWSEDGFGFVTAMAQEDPEMRRYIAERREASLQARGLATPCADTEYWAAQTKRHELLKELLDEARQNPTLEVMRAMIHFRCDKRGQTVYYGEPIFCNGQAAGNLEHTLITYIAKLREGRALWWTYDKAKNTPVWKNPQPEIDLADALVWK
jgi:hypothetical protein